MKARWLAALALVLAAVAVVATARADPHPLGWGAWQLSLAAALSAGLLHDRGGAWLRQVGERLAWGRGDVVALVVLTLAAVTLRFLRLDATFPPMHGDEGEMGMLARLALYGPGGDRGELPLPVFGTGFYGHPALFHHLQALALSIGGDSIEALRGFSAVSGALAVPIVYLTARVGWGRTAALAAGWLLAVSHLHLQYSRLAHQAVQSATGAALFALLAVLAWLGAPRPADGAREGAAPRDPRLSLFVTIGLVVGGSQYFYLASRLILVVAVPAMLLLWLAGRATVRQLAVAATACLLALAPQLLTVWRSGQLLEERIRGVSVFREEGIRHALGPDAQWPGDAPRLLLFQVERNLQFFLGRGDQTGFYTPELPAFDLVTLTLFWLGTGAMALRWRRFPDAVVLLWLVLGVVLGGVLTIDPPNGARLSIVIPAVCLAGGIGAEAVARMCRRAAGGRRRGVVAAAAAVVAALVAAAALWLNGTSYFVRYPRIPTYGYLAEMGALMRQHAPHDDLYLLGTPNLYAGHGTLRFLRAGAPAADILDSGELASRRDDAVAAGRGMLVFALPHRREELARFAAEFPGGRWAENRNVRGEVTFVRYELPPGS